MMLINIVLWTVYSNLIKTVNINHSPLVNTDIPQSKCPHFYTVPLDSSPPGLQRSSSPFFLSLLIRFYSTVVTPQPHSHHSPRPHSHPLHRPPPTWPSPSSVSLVSLETESSGRGHCQGGPCSQRHSVYGYNTCRQSQRNQLS